MKIKTLNHQNNSSQEKILTPETGVLNKCLVGRHPSCDLVLNAPEISRVHGAIIYYDGHYYFTDLASSDGSRINNKSAEVNICYRLQPDDIICIGDFLLVISEMEEPQKVNNPQMQTGDLMVRCVQVIEETPEAKTFRFVADSVPFSYLPGQFITLKLEINGKPIKRSYSISSTPSRPHSLEITVKRVLAPQDTADAPPGLVSNWLHDNIKVGSQVKVSEPMGDFTCGLIPPKKLLFISAGSGITPMMSMSRWLLDTGSDSDMVFIHSARTANDVIFRQELELMASRHPNFKLAVNLTGQQAKQNRLANNVRLNKSMLQAIAPDFAERTVYVCGSESFMQGVQTMLKELNFPMQNYHEESFGVSKKPQKLPDSPTVPVAPSSTSTAEVLVFTKSGKEVTYDSLDTILETAEKKGIKLPHMCKMGACQRCKLPLLEGKVHYDEDPGCDNGYVLTCIAQPMGRVAIEA